MIKMLPMPTSEIILLKRILSKLERIEGELEEMNRKLSSK